VNIVTRASDAAEYQRNVELVIGAIGARRDKEGGNERWVRAGDRGHDLAAQDNPNMNSPYVREERRLG
jgi:hypothetical protein